MTILPPSEAASFLGISVRSLYSLCRKGKIAYVTVTAHKRLFLQSDLEAYLRTRRVPVVDNSPVQSVPFPRKGGDTAENLDKGKIRKEIASWR